jgi:simple sugar transport system ATP-binding protein
MYRRAEQALQRIGLEIDIKQELGSCSVAIQQMVAIARALDISAGLLILDEPTSSLDDHEVEELFSVMRRLKSEGLGIVFVTHFLDQVYQVSDRITVLRNGELVGEFPAADLPRIELVAKMLGRDIEEVKQLESSVASQPVAGQQEQLLTVNSLGRKGAIFPFDMTMAKGEVLGLAGLLGSGRTEIARLLFGIDHADSGSVSLVEQKNGTPVCTTLRLTSPRKAIARHIAFCSEDRKVEGIIPSLSVRENIIVALQARRGPFRPLSRAEQERIAGTYIEMLDIKTPSHDTPVNSLSGGNQQKVLLARWLAMEPRLMILDEPTRGIDVGAKAEIEKLVQSLSREGMSILFISSELEEVVRNCQRLLVLRDRRKIGELEGDEIGEHTIMNMIAGTHEE